MEIANSMSPVTDLLVQRHQAPTESARDAYQTTALGQSVAATGQDIPQAGAPEIERRASGGNLSEAVTQLNTYVQSIQRTLNFSVDEDTGRTVVKVIDTKTEEVIRQIPAEEVLNMLKHLATDADCGSVDPTGIFLQDKA